MSDWILWFQNSCNKVAIEIRFVQLRLRLKAESWDWIDWQVSRGSTRKKMVEGAKNENTQRSKKKGLKRKYWRVQTEALKIKIATVHKISSEDYERDSLRVLVTAIKRYLTEKVSKRSICHNRKLRSLKQLLGETRRQQRDRAAA